MPQVEVEGLTINYDVQGEGDPLLLIPYLSADHACYAFQLPAYTEHFSCIALDLPGTGESDKPRRAVLDRGLCRPGRRLPRRHRGRAGPRRGRLARRRRGHAPCRPPSRPRALALVAQRLGRERPLSDDHRRAVAHARVVAADRRGHGDPGHLPAVLHARDVRRAAGVRRHAGGLRAQPPRPAAGRVPGPDRGGHRARRERGAGRDRRSDPDHRRSARPRLLPRFAERLNSRIGGSELVVFEHLSHAGLHEDPETFNRATLDFLLRRRA